MVHFSRFNSDSSGVVDLYLVRATFWSFESIKSPGAFCFCGILLRGVLADVSLSSMILLTAANCAIWKPRIEDMLYSKDLFDPIELLESN